MSVASLASGRADAALSAEVEARSIADRGSIKLGVTVGHSGVAAIILIQFS